MKEIRYVKTEGKTIPLLISDEKEALLAARAAGGAIVGFQGEKELEWGLADFIVDNLAEADDAFLERAARRQLGLPWHICHTRRLTVREICREDFSLIRKQKIGPGFESEEAMEAYRRNQYGFYGFGLWALEEKGNGRLAGIAGLCVPREWTGAGAWMYCGSNRLPEGACSDVLELGYHVFSPYRRKGLGMEACLAILEYGRRELNVFRYAVWIETGNLISEAFARALGFSDTEPEWK